MLLRRVIAHFRKQEWTAIALDFLIVVVGILLAFQITEWNETRKDRLREGIYLTRIAVELDESIVSIRDAIWLAEQRGTLGELLIRAADDPTLYGPIPAGSCSRFSKADIPIRRIFAATPSRKSSRWGLLAC